MPSALASIVAFYDNTLQPVSALAWIGGPISILDVAAAFRLALILRQMRELFHNEHLAKTSSALRQAKNGQAGKDIDPPEQRGCGRNLATNFLMVFGGEAVVAPWLGVQPSFFLSGGFPLLFLGIGALVDSLPTVPELSLFTELPLAILDGFTRATFLCNFVPPMITTHVSPAVANSPYTLLLTAFVAANAGPFIVNVLSLLRPTPMTLTTPPELLPYGWTATDLWIAPLVTGLYATLTHAQPFFAHLHALLFLFFSPLGLAPLSSKSNGSVIEGAVVPLNADDARAVCVLVLSALFSLRAVRMFGLGTAQSEPAGVAYVTSAPMTMLNGSEGEQLERELAARVAGAEKEGYTRTPSSRELLRPSLLRGDLTVSQELRRNRVPQ
ncbi:hypothetical protein EI94DRAFT_1892846 [Lactarius quietus]|nr:hypothetical protein EI94DRAFT_1892846 [Lactarius quietus]